MYYVIWLTGLSGAGKTTIALSLCKRIKDANLIDGDMARTTFCSNLGFSKQDRDENIRRIAVTAAGSEIYHPTIVSVISPYRERREYARSVCGKFIEVFVDCPLQICESRDVKGLYKKVRAGEIKSFTGVHSDAIYEEPLNPDIHLHTNINTIDYCVDIIMDYLRKFKYET